MLGLHGSKGSGKTTLLHQLPDHFSQHGVNLQFIMVELEEGGTLQQILHDQLESEGLFTPVSGMVREDLFIYHGLSQLRNPSKDICLICLDDSHHLSRECIAILSKLFHPDPMIDNLVIILASEEPVISENVLEVTGFTFEEGSRYLHRRINGQWHPMYAKQHDWILENSQLNPGRLSQLSDALLKSNKVTPDGFIAQYDDLVNTDIEMVREIATQVHHFAVENPEQLEKQALSHTEKHLFRSALKAWETLYQIEKKSSFLFKIGLMHYELRNIDRAQKIFQECLTSDESEDYAHIHYYLGRICEQRGNLVDARQFYNFVEHNLHLDAFKTIKIQKNIIRFYLLCGDLDAFNKRYESFKKKYENSPADRIEFLDLVCSLHDRLEIETNIIKLAKEGMRLAKRKNDLIKLKGFHQTFVTIHERRGEFDQALRLIYQIEKDFADDQLYENDAYHLALKARILFQVGKTFKAYQCYKQAAAIFQFLDEPMRYLDCIQAILSMESLVGNIKQMLVTQKMLEVGIQNLDEKAVILPKFSLACSFHLADETSKATKILKQIREYALEMKDDLMIAHVQSNLAPLLFRSDKPLATEYWETSKKFFISNNLKAYLPAAFYNIGWALVNGHQLELLKNLTEDWLSCDPASVETFHYRYIKAAEEIMAGRISSGLTRISLLEDSFTGIHIWEWHKMYEWLSDQAIKAADQSKYKRRAQLTRSICLGDRPDEEVEKDWAETDYDSLLFEWAHPVVDNRPMNIDVVEDFFHSEERTRSFLENLKFWGLECSHGTYRENSTSTEKPIVINLLGAPELYINNRKLSSRDWTSRKALEILTYIIIRSWRHKQPIQLTDLLHDLWTPDKTKMDSSRLVRNNMLTRLRKVFDGFDTPMLISTRVDIRFNWESGLYRLDIEQFESALRKLKGSKNNPQTVLNSLKYLYRGQLADGFDGLWLEGDRRYFQEQYIKTVESIS